MNHCLVLVHMCECYVSSWRTVRNPWFYLEVHTQGSSVQQTCPITAAGPQAEGTNRTCLCKEWIFFNSIRTCIRELGAATLEDWLTDWLYFTLLYFTLLYFTSLHFTFQYELESLIFWRNWSLSLNHCSGLRVFMFLLPLKDIHMLRMHWGGIEGLNYTWTVYWTDDSLRVGSKIQSVVQNVLNFEFWRHSVLLFPLRRRWVNETSGIYLWKSGPWTFTTSCVGR